MYHVTTFLGHSITLYLPDPNWISKVHVGVSFKVDVDESTSAREDRRPRQSALRHTFEALFTLSKEQSASLHANVASPRTEYIGCPLFPDKLQAVHFGQSMWNAQFYINWDDSGYHIYAAAEVPATPPKLWTAPLLVGRLEERPKLKLLTDETAQFELKFVERSPWAFRLAPKPVTVGADWPEALQPNWIKDPEDWTEDDIRYIDIGDSRTEAVLGGESAPRRFQSAMFTLRGRDQIRLLLNFFLARKGRHQSFLCPWLFRPADDSIDTPHQVKVRFATDDLELEFVTDELVEVQITFAEVPWELTPVVGETPSQAPKAYLYRFGVWSPDGYTYFRYTNWEHDLVRLEGLDVPSYVPQTYAANTSIQHDGLTSTDDLSDPAVTITAAMGQIPPLMRLLQRKTEVPVELRIIECDPNNVDATAKLRFRGEITRPRSDGQKAIAPAEVFGGLLELKVPNFYFGKKCNHDFCSVGCTKNMNAIRATGTIASKSGANVTVNLATDPANSSHMADGFAGGLIEMLSGVNYDVRTIVRSAAAIAGQVVLTLKRGLDDVPLGTSVKIEPTCSGTRQECQVRWNNYINFGAHPHIGPRNLSIPQREFNRPIGKK